MKKYQVFVSSTYTDLKEERIAVTQCLLDNDCIPVGMEQFPASEMSQMEYIKKMLEDCDYYILILAGRYGSLDTDEIGYTEKEYDYACELGIPVMSFLYENLDDIPFGKSEQDAIGRDKLEQFRKKVSSGRLIKKYANIDQLKAEVSTSLNRCIKDYPAKGWIRNDENYGSTLDYRETKNSSVVEHAMQEPKDEINYYEDMHTLQDIVLSTIPEMFHNVLYTKNAIEIEEIVNKIHSAHPNQEFWFNTGTRNNTIQTFTKYKSNQYILNGKVFEIIGMWGSFTPLFYNDIFIFHIREVPPVIIENIEYNHGALINNEVLVPAFSIESGFVRYKGKVRKVEELEIKEMDFTAFHEDKYLAIGTCFQSSIYQKNDPFLCELQLEEDLTKEKVLNYKKSISKNKHNRLLE